MALNLPLGGASPVDWDLSLCPSVKLCNFIQHVLSCVTVLVASVIGILGPAQGSGCSDSSPAWGCMADSAST